ncbi:MAG: thioesterase family protein [Afipia sp.]|nr:thioesterase family protein [Afipia sp.]
MTEFSVLLASITTGGDTSTVTATDDWLQGRTIYGGLAAAFCLEAVSRQQGELPPLRSAQFSFVGPASGPVTIRSSILRKGKSTVFAAADLSGDAGLATRATLCYGAARTSEISINDVGSPQVDAPEKYPPFFRELPGLNFVQHFESHIAAGSFPMSRKEPTMTLWLRHRDPAAPVSTIALIALADAPPPAAIVKFTKFAPISTMTWSIDMLTDRLETEDGWWLLRTTAETAANGYSSQAMTVWNSKREPVMIARQNVAVFA